MAHSRCIVYIWSVSEYHILIYSSSSLNWDILEGWDHFFDFIPPILFIVLIHIRSSPNISSVIKCSHFPDWVERNITWGVTDRCGPTADWNSCSWSCQFLHDCLYALSPTPRLTQLMRDMHISYEAHSVHSGATNVFQMYLETWCIQ